MNYEDLLELVKKRRSLRRFKSDPVPDEYIDKIIEVARWAPSGFNQQPWEFVVVRKKELRDRIVQLVDEYRAIHTKMEKAREEWQYVPPESKSGRPLIHEMDHRNAPVFIILYGDPRLEAGLPMSVRCDPYRSQLVLESSLANAYLYMHLAATALGLASQWLSGIQIPYVDCMVKDLLGIPMSMEVYDMMVLGYGAMEPGPKLLRDNEKMVHYDHCGEEDFRSDDEVRDFVNRARAWRIAAH